MPATSDMVGKDKITLIRRVAGWQALIIVVAIAAISVSLATRLCQVIRPHAITVGATGSQGMRQHMDQDAVAWVAPVARFIFLQPATYYPKFAPAGPPLPTVLIDSSLYNRPPPSSSVLA